ncbi:DUF805 domain-containing protein [Loktanella sp. D2R18]|uniref:DUF805 domain-containing protein n=1 Tax=Rhodobacterales TaxID=204455 RepID=UPI000DEA6766|nr:MULTISPECIES: DUF805 domain-containing protein [Rhodobacterales]MDO6590808.1 DUF805 domain-containing protein [Yoonia sp. 1_MG-2023]RBW43243.1 DUF805 domain-containing protein [Loktanella sp. D2R18]
MDFNASLELVKKTLTTKYADFAGRAGRTEFWTFIVFSIVVNVLASVIFGMIGLGIVATVVSLALVVPSVAVTVRRLHDRDMTGWLALVGLIPLLGALWLLYTCYFEGTEGANQFGEQPAE